MKRLRRGDRSYREISDLLGVSSRQIRRIMDGRTCRCGGCPRPRKLDELLALTPKPRARPPAEDDGEDPILGVLLRALQAAKTAQDAQDKARSPQTGW